MARQASKKFKKRKDDYEQRLIDLRRVARVVAGGRRFSFRATLVLGNKKGEVGLGSAKGADTALAIEKAVRRAKKSMAKFPITKDGSIPHFVGAKFSSAFVILRPAKKGRGLVAGSSVRAVLELAGYKNVTAKVVSRSKNKLNNAKATISALRKLSQSQSANGES